MLRHQIGCVKIPMCARATSISMNARMPNFVATLSPSLSLSLPLSVGVVRAFALISPYLSIAMTQTQKRPSQIFIYLLEVAEMRDVLPIYHSTPFNRSSTKYTRLCPPFALALSLSFFFFIFIHPVVVWCNNSNFFPCSRSHWPLECTFFPLLARSRFGGQFQFLTRLLKMSLKYVGAKNIHIYIFSIALSSFTHSFIFSLFRCI